MFGGDTEDGMKEKAKKVFVQLRDKFLGLEPRFAALLLCAALLIVLIPISFAGGKTAENNSSRDAAESAEETTATLAGPPEYLPTRALAQEMKNAAIPVRSRNAPNIINTAIYLAQT